MITLPRDAMEAMLMQAGFVANPDKVAVEYASAPIVWHTEHWVMDTAMKLRKLDGSCVVDLNSIDDESTIPLAEAMEELTRDIMEGRR